MAIPNEIRFLPYSWNKLVKLWGSSSKSMIMKDKVQDWSSHPQLAIPDKLRDSNHVMTQRVTDWESGSDLGEIRNSCDFLASHLNVKAIFCSNVIVVNCNFRRSTSHWLPPRSWPEASWHWVVVICTFIIFVIVITWNKKFGWFEMFNRIYNLSHATGADGTEAFKSKLKFQIQHEVFRWCDLCIAHIVWCSIIELEMVLYGIVCNNFLLNVGAD